MDQPTKAAPTRHSPKTKTKPTAVDIYAGERLRQQRLIMKLSQASLASVVDVSCQQIQKYEKGRNRISTGTLYLLAQVLEVSLDYFVEGFAGDNHAECQQVDASKSKRHLARRKT